MSQDTLNAPPLAPPGDGAVTTPELRRARRIQALGYLLYPLVILALSGLFYLYRRHTLSAADVAFGAKSALEWDNKLWPQLIRHLEISLWSTVLVIVVAIPLGILLTRAPLRRVAPAIIAVANSGQALPAFGLLAAFLAIMGLGMTTAIVALAVYALLPVLRNTMVGLDGIDRSLIEAGRGMGMTKAQVLGRIELPLAVPVIIAGIRTAIILNIGMATLAYTIGGGGLGITISSGLKNQVDPVLICGAWLVILVALTFDWAGSLAERYLRPKGI